MNRLQVDFCGIGIRGGRFSCVLCVLFGGGGTPQGMLKMVMMIDDDDDDDDDDV